MQLRHPSPSCYYEKQVGSIVRGRTNASDGGLHTSAKTALRLSLRVLGSPDTPVFPKAVRAQHVSKRDSSARLTGEEGDAQGQGAPTGLEIRPPI